jgi:hypothetical protein
MRFKLLMGTALLALCTNANAAVFFLSCNLVFRYDGTSMSTDFKIDEENRTVNGTPAVFTDTAISYKISTSSGEMVTLFSRLTGGVTVSTDIGIVAQGTCAVANARKF